MKNASRLLGLVLFSTLGASLAIAQGTGGAKAANGAYSVHSFSSNGTFTLSVATTVDFLMVGGGGGGSGGGGGAGGYIYRTSVNLPAGSYPVTVGSGGAAGASFVGRGGNGGSTSFYNDTAWGGGGGGSSLSQDPGSGGSGGGSGRVWADGFFGGGGWVNGQGTGGGGCPGNNPGLSPAGGGGGSSGWGGNGAKPTTSGNGGTGTPNAITGTTVYYAGGGGGGSTNGVTGGYGGSGGGGNGSSANGVVGGSGTNGLGGGGGGSYDWTSGGAGGSGVVIIRYVTRNPPTVEWCTGELDRPPSTLYQGSRFTMRATGRDADGDLGAVWVQYRVNPGTGWQDWQPLAYDNAVAPNGNGSVATTNPNGIIAGPPGTSYQFQCFAWDGTGWACPWLVSGVYTVANRPASISSIGASPTSIVFGQSTTVSVTGNDDDGNLAWLDWMVHDGSNYYRPGNVDYSHIGWNGYTAGAGWSGHNFSSDAASNSSPTHSATFTPPYVATFDILAYAGDPYAANYNGAWASWYGRHLIVSKAGIKLNAGRPPGWTDQSNTGTCTFPNAFNVTLSNPYNPNVAQPTGGVTFAVVGWNGIYGAGAEPTSGAVGPGTSFKPGVYTVRCHYAGDSNYNAGDWDATFTVYDRYPRVTMSASPTTIEFGQTTTVTATAADDDGNLWFHGLLWYNSSMGDWNRGPLTDHSTGWGNHPTSATIESSSYTSGAASGSTSTRSFVHRPPAVGTHTYHSNTNDQYVWASSETNNWNACVGYAYVTVNQTTPKLWRPSLGVFGWADQTRSGAGCFPDAFSVTLVNAHSAAVPAPAGALSFAVVSAAGSGSSPASGAAGPSTWFTPGVYVVRCSYAGDSNYRATSWDATFTVSDVVAPSVPVGLSASSLTATSFTLSWSASTDDVGVTGYEVMRDATSLGTTTATSITVAGLSEATSYATKVRARDAAGNWSGWSNALVVRTLDVTAPSVPTGLSAANLTPTSFTLNWTPSTDNVGVTAYEVSLNGAYYGTVTANTMAIAGLSSGVTYQLRVRARDQAGNWSGLSTPLSVTTLDNIPPSVPAGISASNITATGCTLSWSASSDNVGVTVYEVTRDGVSLGTTGGTSMVVSGLSSGVAYQFRVRAGDAAGNWSGLNAPLTVTTLDNVSPSVPSGLAAANLAATSFTLNWAAATDNVGVTGYEVSRDGASLGTATTTSMAITGLSSGVSYQMKVRARDAAGNWSNWSSPLPVTTLDNVAPSVPLSLAAANVTATSLTLSWAASTDNVGVAAYEVMRDTTSIGEISASPRVVAGLTSGTRYLFKVRARDAAGNWSDWSSPSLQVTTLDDVAPSIPAGLGSPDLTATSFRLTWAASTDNVGVTGYQVRRDGVDIGATADPFLTVTGLSSGATYQMTVRARDAAGNWSGWSNALPVTTLDDVAPSVPQTLVATERTSYGFNANWYPSTDNVGVTAYQVRLNGQIQAQTTSNPTYALSGLTAEATYLVEVRAGDAAGNWSAWSDTLTVIAKEVVSPPVPEGLTVSDLLPTSFRLSWNPWPSVPAYAGYEVEVILDAVSYGKTTGNYLDIDGLMSGVTYVVRARAHDPADNWSKWTVFTTVTTPDNIPPDVPTGVESSAITANGFTLRWTVPHDNVAVAAYEVARDDVSLGEVPTPTLAVAQLSSGVTYRMKVRARDAAGLWSGWSSPALAVTTLDDVTPTTPSPAAATEIGSSGFTFNWTAATDNVGVDHYEVKRDSLVIGTTTSLSMAATGLVDGVSYEMSVRACDAAGNVSAWSAPQPTTTLDVSAPSVPDAAVVSANTTGTSFTLTWGACSDNVAVTQYQVQVGTTTYDPTSGVTQLVAGLAEGTTYSVRVRAGDTANNWSAWSSPREVTTPDVTPPTVPTGLAISDNSTGSSVTLSWHASSDSVGVSAYEVRLGADVIAVTTLRTLPITGLQPGTSYSLSVRAGDAAGNWSDWSAAATVKTKTHQALLQVTADPFQTYATLQQLSAAGGSGQGAVQYRISAASADDAAILSTELPHDQLTAATGTGWVEVVATKAGDDEYLPATSPAARVTFRKAVAQITLAGLSHMYGADAAGQLEKRATVTVNPSAAGPSVIVTYSDANGQPVAAPVNAGTYSVTAAIDAADADYEGSATATLTIVKAPARVDLDVGALIQTYGATRAVPASTEPAGLSRTVTYAGAEYPESTSVPSQAGTYGVHATITDPNYEGSADGQLTIRKAPATVTFTTVTAVYTDDRQPKSASAITTPAGLNVVFSYFDAGDQPVTPVDAGTYRVTAQIVYRNYEGGATASFTIAKAEQPAVVLSASSPLKYHASQTITASGGSGEGGFDFAPVSASLATLVPVLPQERTLARATLIAATGSGSVDLQVTKAGDANHNPRTSNSVRVELAKADVVIALENLRQVYDGRAKQVLAKPDPAGVVIEVTYNGSAAAPTDAGDYAVAARVPDANPNYVGSASATLTIEPGPQTVTVTPEAAGIEFGQSATFTATGGHNGYVWSGAATGSAATTTVMPASAGVHTITVSSPAGGNYRKSNDAAATLTVAKATPLGTFAGRTADGPYTVTASDLSAVFVNPHTNATLTQTPNYTTGQTGLHVGSVLAAGTYLVTATYPGDDNHNVASVSATYTINKTEPTITWNPAGITAGEMFGPAQLNATASVGGTFDYRPVSGTPATPAGRKRMAAFFTPEDPVNYYSTQKTAEITVAGGKQTITFNPPATCAYDDLVALQASATSGLPVTFTIDGGSAALSAGNMLHATGIGNVVVTAHQNGDANYEAAPAASRTIAVHKAVDVITFPDPRLSSYELKAVAKSGRTVAYSVQTTFAPNDDPANHVDPLAIAIPVHPVDPSLPVTHVLMFVPTGLPSKWVAGGCAPTVAVTAAVPADEHYEAADATWAGLSVINPGWLTKPPEIVMPASESYPLVYNADLLPYLAQTGSSEVIIHAAQTPNAPWSRETAVGYGIASVPGSTLVRCNGSLTLREPGDWYIRVINVGATYSCQIESATLVIHVVNGQAITFPAIGTHVVGDTFALGASSTSHLPITYSLVEGTSLAQIDNATGMITVTGGGRITVKAEQPGDSTHMAARSVTQTFYTFGAPRLSFETFTVPAGAVTTVTGRGWALDQDDGVLGSLRLVIDGTEMPGVLVREARPDIQAQALSQGWTTRDATNCGWSFTLDSRALTFGDHTVRIKATNSHGLEVSAERSFTGGTPGLLTQSIQFDDPRPGTKPLGDPPFRIQAHATSGLPLAFSIDSGPATITADGVVTVGSTAGVVTVRAKQPGDLIKYAAALDATLTFSVGMNDTNGNQIDDDWEALYHVTDPDALAPNGLSYRDNYALSLDPDHAMYPASTQMRVNVTAAGKPSGSSGTVTIVAGNQTCNLVFNASGANWVNPATDITMHDGESIPLMLALGEQAKLTISSVGMEDFVVRAEIDPFISPVLQAAAMLDRRYLGSIGKSEIAANGECTLEVFAAGSLPFASIDTSTYEVTQMAFLGLGESRSGAPLGRIMFRAGYPRLIRGLALDSQHCRETLTHTQISVPSGYVDVAIAHNRSVVRYYPGDGSPIVGDFKDFSAVQPLATYTFVTVVRTGLQKVHPEQDNVFCHTASTYTITRDTGGVMMSMDALTEPYISVDRYNQEDLMSGGISIGTKWQEHTRTRLLLHSWHKPSAAPTGLTVVDTRTFRLVLRYNGGGVGESTEPVEVKIRRYLGTTESSPVGSQESRHYTFRGEWAFTEPNNVIRGNKSWYEPQSFYLEQFAQVLGGPTLAKNVRVTTNGRGGRSVSELLMNGVLTSGGYTNLDGESILASGQPKFTRRSFLDNPLGSDADVITTYTYTPGPVDGMVRPQTAITKQGATPVGSSRLSYTTGTFGGFTTLNTTTRVAPNRSANLDTGDGCLITMTKGYSGRLADLDLRGKPLAITSPDLTKVVYAYQRSGTDLVIYELRGVDGAAAPAGAVAVTSYGGLTVEPVSMVPGRSTVVERVIRADGKLTRESTRVCQNAATFPQLSAVTYSYDTLGNLTGKTDAAGRQLYAAGYIGFRKDSEVDEQGIHRSYTYDDFDRVETTTRAAASEGLNRIASLTTTYKYDEIGRPKSETVGNLPDALVTIYGFDVADRPTSRILPGRLTTSIEYVSPTKTVTTIPGGGAKEETVYADGRTASVGGTAVPPSATVYAYNGVGNLVMTQTTAGQSVQTESDWAGRLIAIETPTFGDGVTPGKRTVTNAYNALGQLTSQATTSGGAVVAPARMYQYDALGRLKTEWSALTVTTEPDRGADYDVKDYESGFSQGYSAGGAEHDTANWYRYERVKVYPHDGLNAAVGRYASQAYAQLTGLGASTAAHVVTIDFDHNVSESLTTVDTSTGRVETATSATGTTATTGQVSLNGLVIRSTNAQGQTTVQTYDALGRVESTTDARLGTHPTTYTYVEGTALVDTLSGTDHRTTVFGYDFGRVTRKTIVVDKAGGGTENQSAYFEYDFAGNLTHQWGETIDPVRYHYNSAGQRDEMHTYPTRLGGEFVGSTRPAAFSQPGSTTSWTYQPETGQLKVKSDGSRSTTYEYNALGQVTKRTDGRLPAPVVTVYSYTAANLLWTVTYSDGTHGLTYAYDRAGRKKTVDDITGRRTFAYYDDSADTADAMAQDRSARLKSEALPGFFGNATLTYGYQYGTGVNGAPTGLQLNTGTYGVGYGYDSFGRLQTITSGGTTFMYGYVNNSNLLETVSAGPAGYNRTYHYQDEADPNPSDRLSWVKHQWGAAASTAVTATLEYNTVGLRAKEKIEGAAWTAQIGRAVPGVLTDTSYGDRLQVSDSAKYDSRLPQGDATPELAGSDRYYGYDAMGNRLYDEGGAYSPNGLNQYEGSPWASSMKYDGNGNLTDAGGRTYAYDAENRLIQVKSGNSTWNYVYDYLGRRVEKSGTGIATTRFLYDGWNVIAELDGSGTVTRTFVWGLDVSGTLQGAGGIGGLLAIDSGRSPQYPIYDGSHNVIGLYDGSGNVVAGYEYDAFGNLQNKPSAGTPAALNPFRSATKYTDDETKFVYYGMRYYSPDLGRFINRDPIEEQGGLNLYAFCGNDGVNRYDLLGMEDVFDRIRRTGGAWTDSGSFAGQTYARDNPMNTTLWGNSPDSAYNFAAHSSNTGQAIANGYLLRNPSASDLAAAAISAQQRGLPSYQLNFIADLRQFWRTQAGLGSTNFSHNERVVAPTGTDYFGAALSRGLSDGNLRMRIAYRVGKSAASGDLVRHLNDRVVMPARAGAMTTLNYRIVQSDDGSVLVIAAVEVVFNSDWYPNARMAPAYVQFAEYQHIQDFVAGLLQGFRDMRIQMNAGGTQSTLDRLQGQFDATMFQSTANSGKKYDDILSDGTYGQHSARGTILRPGDFTGYPQEWWR